MLANAEPDESREVKSVKGEIERIEGFAQWWFIALAVVILVFGVATAVERCGSLGCAVPLRATAIAAMVGAAACAVGGVLGFLFGIPRLLQQSAGPAPTGASGAESRPVDARKVQRFFTTNTSLEEISDWLTKIIIGLGLVQFDAIIRKILAASALASSYATGVPVPACPADQVCADAPASFFFALIVVCTFVACLFVYLETRTRLTLLFLGMERASDESQRAASARSAAQPVTQTLDSRTIGSSPQEREPKLEAPTPADERIAAVPRAALKSAAELTGWASAKARLNYLGESEEALTAALAKEPGNIDALLRLAEVRQLKRDKAAAAAPIIAALRQAPNDPRVLEAARTAQLLALYEAPPTGFELAIEIYRAMPPQRDPLTLLRQAAALGQKRAYLSDPPSNPDDAAETRREVLAVLRQVVELTRKGDPVRDLMFRLFDPAAAGGPTEENDLQVFQRDTEIASLIRGAVDDPPAAD